MNPGNDQHPKDVLSPRAARRQFLNSKRGSVKDSTVRAYKYPTKHFVEYCENQGVDTMSDINSYLIESWVQKREAEDVKAITVHKNAKLVRVFIKWAEHSDLLPAGSHEKMRIPDVPDEEVSSDEVLRAYPAHQIKKHLETYDYASRKHALFAFMWETACRASGAIAVDLDDLDYDRQGDPCVTFLNRKSQSTALKNGENSERTIQISDELDALLQDYIEFKRADVTDEYGRKPLFTTGHGRLSRNRIYKDTVALTRPCVYTNECPAGRTIADCEPAQKKKQAMSCPENVSPHPVRRGSITDHINRGWEKELLSERVDVSVEVLEKHYDARTKEEALQRRKEYRDLL